MSARILPKPVIRVMLKRCLIIEVEGSESEIGVLLDRIQSIATGFNPAKMLISDGPEQSARIWRGRKSAFGAVGRISEYYCMDGTIPLGRLPEVLTRISEICSGHGLKVANIFHAGDGNLHPLILYDANNPDEAARAEQAGAEISDVVRRGRGVSDRRARCRYREA